MIWLQVEEVTYYNNEKYNEFLSIYQKKEIILFPAEEDIKKNINSHTIFIAPYDVPKKYESIIPQVKINSVYGALTTQEHQLGITSSQALEKRLGITIVNSSYSINDIGGAFGLKQWTKDYLIASKKGYKVKAILLAGIPGTGKTFFAKCFAGETERKLVFLNLSDILTKNEPIAELDKIHTYLNNFKNDKFIILLDEIEKMIGNQSPAEKQILGAFLTLLNEMHTETSKYKDLDILYIATANNLSSILDNNPEFLRRGRFDELFFINIPNINAAKDIIKLYAKKFNLESIFNICNVDDIINIIEDKYLKENAQANRFPYSPSEIETFFKLLEFKQMARGQITEEIIIDVVDSVIPIIKTAKDGINAMIGQRELFLEI